MSTSLYPGAPLFLVLYSAPGSGKTTQVMRTINPEQTLCIGDEGALLKTAGTACGYAGTTAPLIASQLSEPYRLPAGPSLMELNTWIDRVASACCANQQPWPWPTLLCDDWHNIGKRTNDLLEAQAPLGQSGAKDAFWVIRSHNAQLDLFYRSCKAMRINILITCHQRDPDIRNGVRLKQGGPLLPTRSQALALIGQADSVARMVPNKYSLDPHCAMSIEMHQMGVEDSYPTKDRHILGRLGTLPPSLRECLLAAGEEHGYAQCFARQPSLLFLEELVEAVAAQLHGGDGDLTELRKSWVAQGLARVYVEWATSDGIARFQLQRALAQMSTSAVTVNLAGGAAAPGKLVLPALPPPPPKAVPGTTKTTE